MKTGSSLLLITIFATVVFLFYKIQQKKKWKLVLKIVTVIVLIGIIIVVFIYAYLWYVNRPHEVNTLGKISLGMNPVEVTLLLGKPSYDISDTTNKRYIYTDYSGTTEYLIRFKEGSGVSLVCSYNYINDVFGLGVYDSESVVINKLGEPSNTSIKKDGLSKFISYEKYKVAFEISKGNVEAVCVTDAGKVFFMEEYTQGEI